MWISRSFVRDVRKRKWKAIFRVLWDGNYRRDLQNMRKIIGTGEYELVEAVIPLYKIRHSHSINYHAWVDQLVGKMYDTLWYPPPIKVIRDWTAAPAREVYMVVDGNHRLAAHKIIRSPGEGLRVWLMKPVDDQTQVC